MKESPNLDYINKLSKGDVLFEKNLLNIIRKELSTEIATYHLCLKNKDFKKAADAVHKLSHKIGILGLEKGYKIAKVHETNLLKKDLGLRSEFESILGAMLHFIEKD